MEAKKISYLKVVDDTVERVIKFMQDFNGLTMVEEDQKQFLLRYVIENGIRSVKKLLYKKLSRLMLLLYVFN